MGKFTDKAANLAAKVAVKSGRNLSAKVAQLGVDADAAVATVQSYADQLKAEASLRLAQISDLTNQLSASKAELVAAQQQLVRSQADLATSNTDLAAANAKVSDLTKQVADLKTEVALLQAALAELQQPTPDPIPTGWVAVLNEEFDGTTLDTTQWKARTDSQNNHNGQNTTANVQLHDGVCDLICTRRSAPTASGKAYDTAYLDTIGKPSASQRYGRWEVTCTLPKAKGAWPAFWLRDNTGTGELDVVEVVRDGSGGGKIVMTVHQNTNGGQAKRGFDWKVPATFDWNAQHTFAVEWDGATIIWFVDNVEVTRVTTSAYPWLSTSFTSSGLNIRLNYQAGGSMPDYYGLSMDATSALPDVFRIHRVRVLKRA